MHVATVLYNLQNGIFYAYDGHKKEKEHVYVIMSIEGREIMKKVYNEYGITYENPVLNITKTDWELYELGITSKKNVKFPYEHLDYQAQHSCYQGLLTNLYILGCNYSLFRRTKCAREFVSAMKKSKLLRNLFISTLIVSCFLSVSPFIRIEEAKAEIKYVSIVPIDDARVYEGSPDTNYGSSDYMTVGRQQTSHLEILIRFNLTNAALTHDDLKLKSAVLRLRRRDTYGTMANIQVQVWATQTSWSESTITWNNKPSLLTNYTLCAFTGDKFSESAWRRAPLNKSDIEHWMRSDEKLYSICLTAQSQPDTETYLEVSSKESMDVPSLDLYFAPEGVEAHSQAVVLVDTTIQDLNPSYFEFFARGVEKWLEWWKMDYEEVDLRATTITRALLSSYNLILIGQFNLTLNANLDSSELQAINRSVYEDGVGLVQLDPYLTGYTNTWSGYNELFGVEIQGWVTSSAKMDLTVTDNTHFITKIYRNGTEMNALFGQESDLAFENVAVGGSAETLVVMPYNDANYPALVVKSHGNGRTVLSTFSTGTVDLGVFAGIDGFGERPLRTNSGMHGLLWRSMVWAAKKPFAFMGMPPFLTSTIYGVGDSASLDYIDILVEHRLFVHLNIFADDVYRRGSAYLNSLKNHYWNGTVHIAPNSWTHNWLIYWNLTGNREYDSSTLSQYFDWLDGNQTAWNITFSAWRIPNFCAVGENAVPYLLDREWDLFGCIYHIPYSEGTLSGVWMWDTPQRRCVVVMDFEGENNTLFNVMLFLPVNNATYFVPSALHGAVNPPNVAKATEQMLSQLEHGLADLFWGEAFTFDGNAGAFGASNWDTLLTCVTGNITSQYPFYITSSKEYIARYVLNRRHLSISNYSYASNTLTLNFSGTTKLPMAFYLFTDQKISSYSGILDHFRSYGDDGYLVWIPAYSGNHQVSITLGSSETENPHIHYTMSNVTSTSVSPNAFEIQASAIWRHTDPKYRFEVNCTSRGEPSTVKVDGTPVSFNYDRNTRLVSFNVTFPNSQNIVVSWQENAHLAVRGLNNRIYYRLYNSSSGSWESWNVVPSGSTCDSPVAVVCCERLHIVVRGFSTTNIYANYSLWHGWINLTDGSFSGWNRISGATPSTPTLVCYDSQLNLVVRGLNNRIYHRSYNCTSNDWEGWTALPSGTTCDSPAAAILDGELHIVVRGFSTTNAKLNNTLYHSLINLTDNRFSNWAMLSGATPSALTLTSNGTMLCLVVRGTNNRIYYRCHNDVWSSWDALPAGATSDSPAAAMLGSDLHIVVLGVNGKKLWHGSVDPTDAESFSGWARLSGSTPSAPTLTG